MFILNQTLDVEKKDQIYQHFVNHSFNLVQEISDPQKSMLSDFKNVQCQEPRFVFNQLLPNIDKWNLKEFRLISLNRMKQKIKPKYRQQEIKIFKLISHIDFTSIQCLILNSFQIDTIQPLCHMRFDKLQTISLQSNNITSLKTLSKFYFPNLNTLKFQHNPYIDEEYKYIPKMYLRSKTWPHVILDLISEGHGIYFSIKRHLFKMDSSSAQVFLVKYSHNQYDRTVCQVMRRKINDENH